MYNGDYIAIKDFKHRQAYTDLIAKVIKKDLWEMIYEPMFEIMKIPKYFAARNDFEELKEAIRTGEIYYFEGGFKAVKKFKNAWAKELIKLGASYDRYSKSYLISLEQMPQNILNMIMTKRQAALQRFQHLNDYLGYVQENINIIVENIAFHNEIITILDDTGKQIEKNVKNINVIEPELSEEQKQEIARTYSENMGFYIKNWEENKITQMRQRVAEAILQGQREEHIRDMLIKEYDIAKKKAEFLAQNETSIMLAELKKVIYEEMGFTHFIWNTILDGQERELHNRLHGEIFRFDNPPIIDQRTGQTGLPGETYNCRCSLTPISLNSPFFDQASIDRYKNLREYRHERTKTQLTKMPNYRKVKMK